MFQISNNLTVYWNDTDLIEHNDSATNNRDTNVSDKICNENLQIYMKARIHEGKM